MSNNPHNTCAQQFKPFNIYHFSLKKLHILLFVRKLGNLMLPPFVLQTWKQKNKEGKNNIIEKNSVRKK